MARIDAWTMEEDDMLGEEWGLWPDAVVAGWLGRSVKACENRAYILNIRKRDNIALVCGECVDGRDERRAA
jgi:hypothetical protein